MLLFIDPVSVLLKMEKAMIYTMIAHSYGQFCVLFLSYKFTFEFKAVQNFALSMTTSVGTVGLSILLLLQMPYENNYWGRILGQAITYVLLAVVTWVVIFPKGKTVYNRDYWKFALPIAIPVIFHTLSNQILSQSDRVMLQQLGTASMVGIYSLAASFGMLPPYMYWKQDSIGIVPFKCDGTKYRLTLDMPEDYEVIKRVYEALYQPGNRFNMDEILGYLDEHPEILAINAQIQQKAVK